MLCTQRNTVSMDDMVEHEAARGAAFFEESPLVPTCACLHLLGWQLLTATISHGNVSGYYISSTLLPTPTERLGSCS
jgi:hypothetical protein